VGSSFHRASAPGGARPIRGRDPPTGESRIPGTGSPAQRLKPFRFLAIVSDAREALADLFEAAERELDPSIGGEKLERAREKALHAPVLLAVISRLQENDEVPEIEQRASAGAALGYVVLAADPLATARWP
jgi:hypothetical protein